MTDYLSIAVHAFAMRMLKTLSVDEILLSRFVNWSTNFRGLPLKVVYGTILFKYEFCFIWVHLEANASCCLF